MAHILLIEDDAQFRVMMALMLVKDGHQIATANNGLEGLLHYFQNWPNLVITDILMPEKSGLEIIAEIRKQSPHIPIIAISGGSKDINKESCLSAAEKIGADQVLTKPFSLDEMRKAINYVLGK